MIPFAAFECMHITAPFELRALIEELLDAPDEAARQEVEAALRLWLQLHCRSCGSLIDIELRRSDPPEEYCFACLPPRPAGSRRPITDGDVPA